MFILPFKLEARRIISASSKLLTAYETVPKEDKIPRHMDVIIEVWIMHTKAVAYMRTAKKVTSVTNQTWSCI
jgi:hypothetical protein